MSEQICFMPAKFLIGHPTIDAQHEVLFTLYNELLLSLQCADDSFNLENIFQGLGVYVLTHFQYEEDIMLATQFHGSVAHCEEHQELKDELRVLKKRFIAAKNGIEENLIAHNVATFLAEWLAHHIAEVDRQLAHHLNACSGNN